MKRINGKEVIQVIVSNSENYEIGKQEMPLKEAKYWSVRLLN